MEKLGLSNNALFRWIFFILMFCCIIYGCDFSDKNKTKDNHVYENKTKITKKDNQVIVERETLELQPIKNGGMSVVLGQDFKFFNTNQIESDSTPIYGETFEILEVSQDKYPKDNTNECVQFPYIHISNSRLNGWISGKYVFRIFDEPERRIEISNESYQVYKSKNFGVGSMDSTGHITGCEEYYPIVLKSLSSDNFHIIDLPGGNPIYHNIETIILHKYDEFIEINSDSILTVLKIKTEGMEGGKFYDLNLRLNENNLISGEISNIENWTF